MYTYLVGLLVWGFVLGAVGLIAARNERLSKQEPRI